MQTCAVIPAAGLGKRLGLRQPKILTAISESQTIWSILRSKLLGMVDHIHLVVSPDGFQDIHAMTRVDEENNLVSLSIQPKPRGMGDAIFGCFRHWQEAQTILVIWGDQLFISEDTLKKTLALHAGLPHTVVIPLVQILNPYVEYIFKDNLLQAVKQSREGDVCQTNGLADVGTFALSAANLLSEWEHYLRIAKTGHKTAEINFLPFLPFLSKQHWCFKKFIVDDEREARGINTPEDLGFFQKLYATIKEE